MNIIITGHHLEVTPAIREHIHTKLSRVSRHVNQVISTQILLSVQKEGHKIEIDTHLSNKNIHVEAIETNMYSAIDLVIDKLDRQVLKYKEQHKDDRHHALSPKYQLEFPNINT